MNWWKRLKAEECESLNQEDKRHPRVLDTQLLCCGYEENRRKPGSEWDKNEKPNFPPENQKLELTDTYNPKS